jgi:hypothetical protein
MTLADIVCFCSITGDLGSRALVLSWFTGSYEYGHQQNHYTMTYFEDRPGQVQYKYYDVVQNPDPSAFAAVSISKCAFYEYMTMSNLPLQQMAHRRLSLIEASTSRLASSSASQFLTAVMSLSNPQSTAVQIVVPMVAGTHVPSSKLQSGLEQMYIPIRISIGYTLSEVSWDSVAEGSKSTSQI